MSKKDSDQKNKNQQPVDDVVNEKVQTDATTNKEKEQKDDEMPEKEVVGVEELTKQLAEMKDKHLRLVAEYDNYRKRTLKEKMELSKVVGEKIFVNILPVIDDFDRALLHLDSASDLDAVKEGIMLIYNKFQTFMTQNGVTEVETHEKPFDLEFHEAVTKAPAPSEELKGKIIDCIQKGYMLDGKVIRFPKVVVGE